MHRCSASFDAFARRPPNRSLVPFPSRGFRPPLAALLAGALLACQGGDGGSADSLAVRAPGDAAREFAIAVDRQRPQLTAKDWKRKEAARERRPHRLCGWAIRCASCARSRRAGAHDRSTSRYYYDGAQLRYFESDADTTGGEPPAMHKERLVLAFDKQGSAVEISRQLDGATAPVDSTRIVAVVARAAEVARQWATATPAAKN